MRGIPVRPAARSLAALLALLASHGCSSVHRWPAPTDAGGGVARPHRVLVPTPSCDYGGGAEAEQASCARELGEQVLARLQEEGFDALWPELLGSAGGPPAAAARELAGALPEIARFARRAGDGAPAPAPLAARVRELCAQWPADALLLVHAEVRRPRPWSWVLLATTLLGSWPLLVLDQHAEVRVDVFDAATGRLAWRAASRVRPVPDQLTELLAGAMAALPIASGSAK